MGQASEPRKPAPASAQRGQDERGPPSWIVPAVMISLLIGLGWYAIQSLSDTSKMEDCTMAGRRNCVPPIDTSKLEK